MESLNSLNSLASLGPLLSLSSLSSLAAVNGLTNGALSHKTIPERNTESPSSRSRSSPNKFENSQNSRSPKAGKRSAGDGSTHEDSNTEEDENHVPTINAYMVFSHHMRLKALQEQSKVGVRQFTPTLSLFKTFNNATFKNQIWIVSRFFSNTILEK